MMKRTKKILSCLLLCCFLAASALPVLAADQPENERTITVSSVEDLMILAENCTLDAYSQGLTVNLTADLSISQADFSGIPIFCGTFEGNGHTIIGMNLNREGSVQGLFRYLTDTACVRDLNVAGTVRPEGSRQKAGGIAGINAGRIENCSFQGDVDAADYAGGLVGVNQVSGILETCQTAGTITGSHFVGGIAGENLGLIRGCQNHCGINKTAEQNAVNQVSGDAIVHSEAPDTATDIGGIAGSNTGVIRGCTNRGTVGYQHMGYNVGGIAGSQKGLIAECQNLAPVYGRKEVGGIAGQVEPISKIEYTEDTLQILRNQLSYTSSLADKASGNVHSSAENLSGQMSSLKDSAQAAVDAVEQLIPSKENPHLPDPDAILAAQNTLSSSMTSMQSTLSDIHSTAGAAVSTASSDIRAITGQINAIAGTLDSAAANLGGTVTDVSDSDTEEDLTGKITHCENAGTVSGDLNVGGIAGASSWENSLDPEADAQVIGDPSLNFDRELRAVIRSCSNLGTVTGKKNNVGGIVGNLSLGLVHSCRNTGSLDAPQADCVGGIVGTSAGFIRSSSAKCEISGKTCVGGVAGKASVVSDCLSLTHLDGYSEKAGAVIGLPRESTAETPVSHNFYLAYNRNLGAVDGIDYKGAAERTSLDNLKALADVPEIFSGAVMVFRTPEKIVAEIQVPLGTAVDPAQIPEVPEKEGCLGSWKGLDQLDLRGICFDVILDAEYTSPSSVIQSSTMRAGGMPLMLAEGQFQKDELLETKALEALPAAEGTTVLEGWTLPEQTGSIRLRVAIPEDLDPKEAGILVQDGSGSWYAPEFRADGRYLVLTPDGDDQAICLTQNETHDKTVLILLIGGAVLLIAVIIIPVVCTRRRKKSGKKPGKKSKSKNSK